jgi:UDP-N-acetylglucosamine 2-epimerase (non-hydrolysing)
VLVHEKPQCVLVHGDTPTALMASLAAFYHRIPVGHVEAGLRTYEKYDPFPEEMNRQMIDVLADFYFAPTSRGRDNLLKEGRPDNQIWVTGNTVIDAILQVTSQDRPIQNTELSKILAENADKRILLLTTHRRESLGEAHVSIFQAVRQILDTYDDTIVVFPVHLNPAVRRPAHEVLGTHPRARLIEPLDYSDMAMLMKQSYLVLTDSGGLQEEAPSLGKPVLVLRNTTERPEGVEAGALKLVGTDTAVIVREASLLLSDPLAYEAMARVANPYGDGTASLKIADHLKSKLE